MKIDSIPPEVLFIIRTLNENKYSAFAVGGCVRDSLLKKEPKDWDITTSAEPQAVKSLFTKTIDTGIKHGTVTVVLNGINFEVTTFRMDGEYLDNRKPEFVTFTSSIEEDLSRRDFTINAIAYHPDLGFIDPFNGISDIKAKIIRAVGNAHKRFKEDALRMLRAIRFSAQLDFTVSEDTLQEIKNNNYLITNISQERIREELTKLLTSENPMNFELLKDTGILEFILPEFDKCFDTAQNNPHHIYNVAIHSLHSVAHVESSKVLRWTMLLHDIGKVNTKTTDFYGIDHFYGHVPESKQLSEIICKRLKFDSKTADIICRLIHHHDRDIEPRISAVRKAVNSVGEDIFAALIKVKTADTKAQNPSFIIDRIAKLDKIQALFLEIQQKNECLSLKTLAVNGQDLIDIGFKPGKNLGLALQYLLEAVIEEPQLNKKEVLLELIKKATF